MGKGVFRKVFDGMVEARTREADRIVRMHLRASGRSLEDVVSGNDVPARPGF